MSASASGGRLTYDGFGMCEVDLGQVFQDVNGNGGTSSELNPGHVRPPARGSVNALHVFRSLEVATARTERALGFFR